jgi:uncharacterized membrane protein YoaK (UPF0700 family)
VITSDRPADAWLSFGLAFIGGYGDAASFVLAKTFTGHVTGNLVLGAIAVAAQGLAGYARTSLGHCHFFVGSCPEYVYRAAIKGVAVVTVASYHHGNRSDSDSGRYLGVGIRHDTPS